MADANNDDKPAQTGSGGASGPSTGVMGALAVAGGVVSLAVGVEQLIAPLAKGAAIFITALAVVAFSTLIIVSFAFRQTKITMTVGQIAAGVTFALLVGGGALTYATWHHKVAQVSYHPFVSTSPLPSDSGSPAASSTGNVESHTSRCHSPLTIVSPANGTDVADGNNGVEVKMAACDLKTNEVGWLFDYDTGDGTYNFDGNGGPIITTDGELRFADTPIGNPGDIHKLTVLTLVLADTSCNKSLSQLQSGPPPISLPSGCQITSQVDVYVTYPQSNSG
jgi:hypothetical protein